MEEFKYLDISFADKVSREVVETTYEAANKRLADLVNLNLFMERKSSVVLGWAIAAIVSLIATLVALLQKTQLSVFAIVMSIYGIVAMAVPSIILIRGIHYKKSIFLSGESPDIILSKERTSYLSGMPKPEQDKMLKCCELQCLQQSIYGNHISEVRMVKAYRKALRSLAFGVVIGALLMVILFFVL